MNKNKTKTKVIMVQGTMSNVGKSLIVAGLCRVFMQDGYVSAPFKSQNMALNSFITKEGLEIGRAQAMQAEAAGIEPLVCMNPILLKPTDDVGSQVIVNGIVRGQMKAKEYFEYKTTLIPDIFEAFNTLSKKADIIVIEGAGSPAEINLKQNDIVNMGMAAFVDAPVILVGDIDRGGVFAQLLGTIDLLEEDEKNRVCGLIINKFRGDKTILDPGIKMLEERANKPVVGVIPYMNIQIEEEDSLTDRFSNNGIGLIDVAVIKLPKMSNYTDFDTFEQIEGVSVRYIKSQTELGNPDLVIIPGTKNTISDMKWLRESGLETMIFRLAKKDVPIIGICGGYQILGEKISDPLGVEGGGEIRGMGLLPVETILNENKTTTQIEGSIESCSGIFEKLVGMKVNGYEIHMGETKPEEAMAKHGFECFTSSATGYCSQNIYGTYIHGFFDNSEIVKCIMSALCKKKGIDIDTALVKDFKEFKEAEFDKLADTIRQFMDMDAIYKILGEVDILE